MPPETRRIHNTERLLSYTFQSHKLTCFICLAFQSTSVWTEVLPFILSPLWNLPRCGPVRQYGCTAATYGRCHAQVIRPNYEDICATLIKRPVVLPLSLLSLFLFQSLFIVQTLMISPARQHDVCPCTVAASRLYSSHCGHTFPFGCGQLIWLHLHQEQQKTECCDTFPVPSHSVLKWFWRCLILFYQIFTFVLSSMKNHSIWIFDHRSQTDCLSGFEQRSSLFS